MPSVGWRKAAVRIGSLCPVWCRGVSGQHPGRQVAAL